MSLDLSNKAALWVGTVSLDSLVQLVRKRGNLVFDKNVRLHLNTKESRARVESPLEATLAAIVEGKKSPNFFRHTMWVSQ